MTPPSPSPAGSALSNQDRPSDGRGGLDLGTLFLAVRRQYRTLLVFFIAVVVAAVVGTLLTTKQYRAVAVIQLMPRAGQEIDVNAVVKTDGGGYMEGRDRARTQIQIILSRSVRETVIAEYNALGFTDLGPTADGLDELRGMMSVSPREDTQLVEIAVTHTHPERAAVLANLIAEVYWRSNLELRRDVARDTREWLQGQADAYNGALDEASRRLLEFKQEHNLVDIEEETDDITARMTALQKAAGEATTARVLLEGQLREYDGLLRREEFAVLAGMFDDPALRAVSREHASIMTQAADVLARYGARHPEHQRVMEHIRRVDALIAEEVKRNVDAERAKLKMLTRQEDQINGEMDAIKSEILGKQRLRDQYAKLKVEEERARRMYGSLGERGAEVDLVSRTHLNDVRLVDRAVPPTRPAKPNLTLNLGMALALGLGGGLGLALLRHRFDDSILTTAELEGIPDLRLLGVLPSLPADTPPQDRATYAYDHPRSLAAESLRAIRSVLHDFVVPGHGRRLMVTSCLQGEGKTDVAVGLATAFAALGADTLLVEGDLRRPRLHTVFDLSEGPGLSDALAEETGAGEQVRATPVPGLKVLTCGERVDTPNELLSAPDMASLLDRLSAEFQVIIIDSPPTALVSDSVALARCVDGVVMVVRRGMPSLSLVRRVSGQLQGAGARVVGVAFNDVPARDDALRYGSAYYDDRPRARQTASR